MKKVIYNWKQEYTQELKDAMSQSQKHILVITTNV